MLISPSNNINYEKNNALEFLDLSKNIKSSTNEFQLKYELSNESIEIENYDDYLS